MGKLLTAMGAVIGVAVWFLWFVILGAGLGTAFIALGCILAAGIIAAVMVSTPFRSVLDARVTSTGLLLGACAFVIMAVVLSVPLWIDVLTGLAVIGIYAMIDALVRGSRPVVGREPMTWQQRSHGGGVPSSAGNGHDRGAREPVGAR